MPNGIYPTAQFDSQPRGAICEHPGLALHSPLRDDAESLIATVGSARSRETSPSPEPNHQGETAQ